MDSLAPLRIRDWQELGQKFIEVSCESKGAPHYSEKVFGFLDGLSLEGKTILADSLSLEPLAGEDFSNGILLRYKLGIRKNKYSGKWAETASMQKVFTIKELEG